MGKTKFSKPSKPLTQAHVGQRHGRLVVQREFFKTRKSGRQLRWWECLCNCGNTVEVQAHKAKSGHTRSCGCLWRESITTHGMSKNTHTAVPEYSVWASMIQRCTNPNNKKFERYGGRGITVCKEWRHSFEQFYKDMGARPITTLRLTVERRDNDKGYSPDNCYWATYAEQNRNNSHSRILTLGTISMCMSDWLTHLNLSYVALRYRLANWPLERALTEPSRHLRIRSRK